MWRRITAAIDASDVLLAIAGLGLFIGVAGKTDVFMALIVVCAATLTLFAIGLLAAR